MNNMKPPQVASPPPVIKSSAKVEPPQLIKQSGRETVPPPPPTPPKSEKSGKGSKWSVVVLVILAILVVVAVIVYFIAPNIKEPPKGRSEITPDSITLNKTSLELKTIGAREQLTATVFPADVPENNKNVIWQSGDETVATVDSEGVVRSIANGNAVISAYTGNGLSATCYVTVGDVVTGVTLDKTTLSLKKGEKGELTATIEPTSATNKDVIWTSDNPSVATVSSTGLVTAGTNDGTANIIVTTADGEKTAICVVKIEPPVKRSLTDSEIISLFSEMSNSDKDAFDRFIKEVGAHIPVEGAENISNSYELAIDAYQGGNYSISIQRNNNGKISKIIVR